MTQPQPDFTALQGEITEILSTPSGAAGNGNEGGGEPGETALAALRGRPVEMFRDTEGGNGDRMAARHGDQILCERTAKGRTYYVVGPDSLWQEDRDGEVIRRADEVVQEMYVRAAMLRNSADEDEVSRGNALHDWAKRSDTMGAMSAMSALAVDKYHRRITAAEYFDRRDDLLSTESGVLVLGEDGVVTLRPRTRADRCSLRARATYRPEVLDSPPALVKQFIDTFLPEEGRVELIFKLLGYALRGGNPRRLFVILKGGTTSGKTQLVRALIETLGGYVGASQATVFRTSHEDKPRPDVIALYRRRIAFFAEASKSWRLEASRIKHFTGGDIDPQRGMHSNTIQQSQPSCLPVIYTNEMPKIIGLDPATKRRIIVPVMDHTLPKEKEDPTIKDRFMHDPDVQAWLLAALVRGYSESRRRVLVDGEWRDGMWDVEREFSLTTSDALNEMYHLSDFLAWLRGDEDADAQLLTVPPDEQDAWGMKKKFVAQPALYERYTQWVKAYGDRFDRLEQLSLVDFNRQLQDNHGFVRVSSGGPRWKGYVLREITLTQLREWSAS